MYELKPEHVDEILRLLDVLLRWHSLLVNTVQQAQSARRINHATLNRPFRFLHTASSSD